jgi:succinoglycan biosynthesis protein ExoV
MRAARAGLATMLYYFKIAHGNFGDALNPWLWEKLCPEACDRRKDILFLGIGTVLSPRVPATPIKVVFGSGCGAGQPPRLDDRWRIFCVRGPLTAQKLNLDLNCALTDPAVLARRFCSTPAKKIHPVSLMLHHQSMFEADWRALGERAGFHCIDPRDRVDKVLAEISQTGLLLTEALHGAIMADALRVPWIPLRLYDRFSEFKWRDWTQSMRLPLNVFAIPPVYDRKFMSRKGLTHAFKKTLATAGLGKTKWRQLRVRASSVRAINHSLQLLEKLAREQTPCLSPEKHLLSLEIRLLEKLSEIRESWRNGKFV